LDSGAVFLKNFEDAANAPLTELVATTMVEGLGAIGYDAMNLGAADLLLAPELLRRLAATSPVPFLSANVVDGAGKSPFTRWIIKDFGGQRVGILGLAGKQQLPVAPLPGRNLVVQDPIEAARGAVEELRRTCRLVIVLSQLGLEADVLLARQVPGIDIICGGFDHQATSPPRIEGTTLILHSGAKGMRLGALQIEILPGRGGAWTARTAAKGGEARLYTWQIVPLDANLPDHPALVAILDSYREKAHERQIVQQVLAPPQTPVANPAYVGAKVCGTCHPAQFAQWTGSKHAQALAALARKRQELEPACLRCHVTAYGEPDGYRPGAKDSAVLANVQCEACHGFGREHRGKGKIRGPVAAAICRRCHSTENSPTFKYEPYLKMLGEHAARYFTRKNAPASADPPR